MPYFEVEGLQREQTWQSLAHKRWRTKTMKGIDRLGRSPSQEEQETSSASAVLWQLFEGIELMASVSFFIAAGITGSVMWDNGVVFGKFMEHAVDSGLLLLHGKKVVELVGCIAALLGAQELIWEDDLDQDLIDPFPDYGTTYCYLCLLERELKLKSVIDSVKNGGGDDRGRGFTQWLIPGTSGERKLIVTMKETDREAAVCDAGRKLASGLIFEAF
ncbi:hypothetical protein POTOM_055570 [Populus tomentosa]|uniref:Uncharacterized protein n=1 Tax=Populus tomentosa TaxID=118781 RepID=A0A8X8C5Z2_POPTO|nr:hypothetical protein POTOM_055570 [Populus tomentosa]